MAANRPKLAAVTTSTGRWRTRNILSTGFWKDNGWNGTQPSSGDGPDRVVCRPGRRRDLSRGSGGAFSRDENLFDIAEALTCGTGKLAVDGVVWSASMRLSEDAQGQVQYRDTGFLKRSWRCSGRAQNRADVQRQHLSWNWEWPKRCTTLRRDGFSLTWRVEPAGDVEDSVGRISGRARVSEALCIVRRR